MDTPGGFLRNCRTEETVTITHLPTGISRTASDRDTAVAMLGTVLVQRGDVSVNECRAAMGLPPWNPEPANPWIPLAADGLPPETYPSWRRGEMAHREGGAAR